MENAVQNLSNVIAHAIYEGFSNIEYKDRDWEHFSKTKEIKTITKTRRHSDRDFEVYAMFSQTWSSTALGFGGIGGQAITQAYTTVVRSDYTGEVCVYFGSRFAYKIERPNATFYTDAANRNMKPVNQRSSYEQAN